MADEHGWTQMNSWTSWKTWVRDRNFLTHAPGQPTFNSPLGHLSPALDSFKKSACPQKHGGKWEFDNTGLMIRMILGFFSLRKPRLVSLKLDLCCRWEGWLSTCTPAKWQGPWHCSSNQEATTVTVQLPSMDEWFSGGCFGGQWAHGCLAAGRLEDWFFLLAVNISGVHVKIACGCIPIFVRKDWCTQSVQSLFWGTPAFGKVVPGLVKKTIIPFGRVFRKSRALGKNA